MVANTLAEEVNADIVEIMDLNDRKGPLNYIKASVDAFRENKTAIKPESVDLTDYDLVYLGSPTWASKPAPAMIAPLLTGAISGVRMLFYFQQWAVPVVRR